MVCQGQLKKKTRSPITPLYYNALSVFNQDSGINLFGKMTFAERK